MLRMATMTAHLLIGTLEGIGGHEFRRAVI
jgi:hypothetical protein